MPRIGIDLMGSENAPRLLLGAVFELILTLHLPSARFFLLGPPPLQKECESLLTRFSKAKGQIFFQEAEEVIEADENPLTALRHKKNSSMAKGILLLKEGKLDAFVSAGNTGAIIALSSLHLPLLSDTVRPALLALMPTKKQPLAVLDIGANTQYTADHLVQFAKMGAAYQMSRGIKDPKIGLLNIGHEALKGTSEVRCAYQKLQSFPNFRGNIEAKEVFQGEVDVLITDGFTGNVFLKTAEGIANLILDRLKENISEQEFSILEPYLNDLQKHLHYAEYPGALLAGLQGIVIKCHGYSSPKAIMNGIRGALELVEQKFLEKYLKIFGRI